MEWIKWEGGECPVQKDALVDVRFSSGVVSENETAGSWYWQWSNGGGIGDIAAYRLSAPTAKRMTLEEAYEDAGRPISDNALNEQVGGSHYLQFEIQPIEFINANKLDFLSGNVVKYISRHRMKGGAEDVNKVIHYCKLILEMQYGE